MMMNNWHEMSKLLPSDPGCINEFIAFLSISNTPSSDQGNMMQAKCLALLAVSWWDQISSLSQDPTLHGKPKSEDKWWKWLF